MKKKIDLRVQKTYRSLHNAFTELLKKKSFEELTVSELCEKAMIRKNTFYLHFSDKYEYFSFYLSELREEFQENISNKEEIQDAKDYSLHMLHEMFLFVRTHKDIIHRLKSSNHISFLYEALQEQVSIGIYDIFVNIHQYTPSSHLDLVISFYAGGIINVFHWWINHPNDLDEDTIADKLLELIPLPSNV